MNFTKSELIKLLQENNKVQPKAKYSNNIIITMLENLPDYFEVDVEPTRSGFLLNRGSVVECIIRAVITNEYNQTKHTAKVSDLDTTTLEDKSGLKYINGLISKNIEIKFSTSFAPATAKHNKAHKVLIVCEDCIFLINSRDLITTKVGKINAHKQNSQVVELLYDLMDRLGF